ncbi:hypothetical protein [uncultured Treponema sp.]|uniref:hypothetical protein n=1 Tax=uncultured Treponema sp. TaxID=162155 RepID=UPI0025D4B908|nr:hypothetical protein [uncultured Treponema sp.]
MHISTRTILLCIVAEALNLITAYIFYDTLQLPLFMDTIFTVAITFYCGLLPGVLVAIFYNVIATLTFPIRDYTFEPYAMLFAICGALVAFSTWLFARHKEDFRISKTITVLYLILIALVSSFMSVIAGGVIDCIRFTFADLPDRMAPIKDFTDTFRSLHYSLLASCFLGQIPVSLTDRMITTFAGYGVYRCMVRVMGNERWK